METKTIIERLNSEVLDYAKAGTHDRETLERFSVEYRNLLQDKPMTFEDMTLLCDLDGFILLTCELASTLFKETERGDILWNIAMDCHSCYFTDHTDARGFTVAFTTLVNYTFNEGFRNAYDILTIYSEQCIPAITSHRID